MKFVLKLKVKVLHYDVVESCQKNLTCYHLGRWMMLVEKDHDGLLIIVVVQTLMSLVLQLVQCFRLIDPLSEIELDLLLRMFYVLKVSMHVVLVLMLALCHDCH